MKPALVFLAAFCRAALGLPFGEQVVHQTRGNSVAKLINTGSSLDAKTKIPVRIAMKQRNLDKGMDLLMDVSDPASPNYGKHYTAEQVVELFSPAPESIETVKSWLTEAGITGVTSPKSKGWLDFETTVDKLESLLKTSYNVYEHTSTGKTHFGTDSYKLPEDVSSHVDFIYPGVVTSSFANAAPSKSKNINPGKPLPFIPLQAAEIKKLQNPSAAATGCDQYVTPACIKSLYNITAGTGSNANNRLGIFESDDEYFKQSDLNTFYKNYATNIPSGFGPKIDLIDFGSTKPNANNAGGEAALDFDVAIPVIYPQSTELYQTKSNFDGRTHLGFINQFLDAVDGSYCTSSSHGETGDDPTVDGKTANEQCGTFKPTNVISFSYGLDESLYPANYLERQCDEFMKLGLQGSTLVFSSGDGGVAGGHGGDCLGDDGTIFNPSAPGSCPYVTSVGSTILPSGGKVGDAEESTYRFSSGGGFSNIWTAPDYQKSAVSAYFANHNPGFSSYNTSDGVIPSNTNGVFNRAGRGYPDISIVGDFGVVVFNGQSGRIGGTSMSAPIFAGIFTRINEERLKAGKSVIGFVNPALYKNTAMFHDITLGGQSDSAGNGACDGKAFSSVSGWDPVSGLGTPNYPAFLSYFQSL